MSAQNRSCEARFWGPKPVCKMVAAPGAMWQGSLTGLGTGAILGAFFAGLATRKTAPAPTLTIQSQSQQPTETKPAPTAATRATEPAALAPPAALTSLQTEVLYCLLALLTAKQISSEAVDAEAPDSEAPASGNLPELRTWAETMARSQPDTYDVTKLPDLQAVTVEEARQLLIEAGFSVQAVDQAWQLMEAASPMPPLT